MKYEPCSICEEYIEGVICDKDKCPVGKMKKELELLHKLQEPTETSGFKIENGKVIFYTNILNGYRHEYENIEEVARELNLLLQSCYKSDDIVLHYKGKAKLARYEAIQEFAERLSARICDNIERSMNNPAGDNYFITDVYKTIDNLVKEMTEVDK